jgi:hypothetical protein
MVSLDLVLAVGGDDERGGPLAALAEARTTSRVASSAQ